MRAPGFVYVMVDPSSPHLVSIGRSDGPPEDRAQAGHLELLDAAYFSDAVAAEGFVQDALETYRADHAADVFEVPAEVAMQALSEAMKRHVGERTRPATPAAATISSVPTVKDPTAAAAMYDRAVVARASRDASGALQSFQRAARLGEPRAFLILAEMTEQGEGCSADGDRAIEWLMEGARQGSRECWGGLADRRPEAVYFRAYFDNAALSSLTAEQCVVVRKRLQSYIRSVADGWERADEQAIERALRQLDDRELSRQWQAARKGAGPSRRSSGILTWLVALTLAGTLGILGPKLYFKYAPRAASEEPAAAQDAADGKAEKGKAGKASAPASAKARPRPKTAESTAPVPEAAPVATVHEARTSHAAAPLPAEEPAEPAVKVGGAIQKFDRDPTQALTGDELRELFSWGREKSDSYRNLPLRLTDIIQKVGKHDISFKGIKCKLQGDPPAGLQVGSTITVEGVIQGKGRWTGTIAIESCRVR